MLTLRQARQLYNEGAEAAKQGLDLRRAISDLGGSWAEMKAYEMGYQGIAWDVREYERLGNIPDGPSYNYMDQRPERGVSVVTDEWRETIHGIFFITKNGGRKLTTFRGVHTGHYGGDGEPLVLPIK